MNPVKVIDSVASDDVPSSAPSALPNWSSNEKVTLLPLPRSFGIGFRYSLLSKLEKSNP